MYAEIHTVHAEELKRSHTKTHVRLGQVKKLTYFTLKAAIFPAVCCMEVGGADYEGQPVSMGPFTNDLAKVRQQGNCPVYA